MVHSSGVRARWCSPMARYSVAGNWKVIGRPSAIRSLVPAETSRRPAVPADGRRPTRSSSRDGSAEMKPLSKYTVAGLFAFMAVSSAVAAAQEAANQNHPPTSSEPTGGPAPVHDLSGTWLGAGEAAMNKRMPPMTPEGQAKLKINIPDPFSATSNDPWKTCDPFGMPRIVNNEIREIGFATMPDRIVILENYAKVWREVWTDGRPLPKNVGHQGGPSTMYFGYSVGHWEGNNTLVVDTVGMDDKTWVDRRGYPHSIDAHVIERYTRTDHNHLTMTETVEDPAYYTQPFVIAKADYRRIAGQDNPTVAVPFSNESMCMPSEALEDPNPG